MRSCIIYALTHPDTGEVRYIGKTVDLPGRIREHRFEARNPKSPNHHTWKSRWWRSLGDRDPAVEIVETVSVAESDQAERDWIRTARNFGVRLTNIADGGEGWTVGREHSEATKAKLRASAKARGITPPSRRGTVPWNKGLKVGKPSSTSFAKGQRAWNKGRRKSECVRGHQLTDETRYYTPAGRYAGCKTCLRENSKTYHERKTS